MDGVEWATCDPGYFWYGIDQRRYLCGDFDFPTNHWLYNQQYTWVVKGTAKCHNLQYAIWARLIKKCCISDSFCATVPIRPKGSEMNTLVGWKEETFNYEINKYIVWVETPFGLCAGVECYARLALFLLKRSYKQNYRGMSYRKSNVVAWDHRYNPSTTCAHEVILHFHKPMHLQQPIFLLILQPWFTISSVQEPHLSPGLDIRLQVGITSDLVDK